MLETLIKLVDVPKTIRLQLTPLLDRLDETTGISWRVVSFLGHYDDFSSYQAVLQSGNHQTRQVHYSPVTGWEEE